MSKIEVDQIDPQSGTELTIGSSSDTIKTGGNLDTNDKNIVTSSNRDLNLYPNGTGAVEIGGNTNPGTIILNCESNSHGIKLQSPAHSAGQSYTIKFPTGNITAGKFLKVDSVSGSGTTGIGQLSFDDAGGGAYTKILHTTASSVANVAFNSTYLTSTYQDYKVVFSNVHCATDAQRFFLEVSADNGSSFKNLDQNVLGRKDDGANIHSRYYNGSQADLQLQMNEDIGNDAGLHISGEIEIFNPSATDNRKLILGRSGSNVGDSVFAFFYSIFGAMSQDTDAINYLKFSWGSGNIASGEFTLYGRKIT